MGLLDKVISKDEDNPGKDIHAGEAYIIWAQLRARYDTLELTQLIRSLANDADFKLLIDRGINKVVLPQIKRLEKAADYYRVALPARPPKSINKAINLDETREEHMYRLIFDGSQAALLVHAKAINTCTNDSLRNMFVNFLNEELETYDLLLRFGKSKGWVDTPPSFKH